MGVLQKRGLSDRGSGVLACGRALSEPSSLDLGDEFIQGGDCKLRHFPLLGTINLFDRRAWRPQRIFELTPVRLAHARRQRPCGGLIALRNEPGGRSGFGIRDGCAKQKGEYRGGEIHLTVSR
jgi:hypothetical protein